jgi:hypothetical protein
MVPRYRLCWGCGTRCNEVVKEGVEIAAACPGQERVSVQLLSEPAVRVGSSKASLLPGLAMVR